eukprot:CAMPEP_0197263140 /NCGR_PEP_ID=MMETSP1432-20130617/959_1 /TAXON_ID=44447 /ORGANISM="Pseudo-nitzschia delicatissima, Strain UNC1205" /LENGTH=398 /DNA_ID=CAMNT_0042727573 /DNA_START=117 /DNA_END=1313 /DNA_ORIENTATION=+
MSPQMNDIDIEEQQLLLSLHHRQLQPLNLPGPNDNINTDYHYLQSHYIEVRKDYRYRENHHESHHESHHMEPTPIVIQNSSHHHVASTVSMSTEEDMLDNFELNLEGDQPDITESGNANTISTDLEPLDAATVSTKSTTDRSCLVTPDLQRNVTMESSQVPATKPKKRKPSPPRSKDPINKKPSRVETPTSQDILCGQSRVCASHPGNRNFQQVLEDFAHNYDIATSKQEKMQMTKAVVSTIHESGGRFLKFKDGMWEEISTVAARDKVSHALRTKVSSWKRQHQQLLQKERDVFAPPRRVSLSRKSRKRERNSYSGDEDDDVVAPLPLEEQSSMKVNDLLQSQQAFYAQLNESPVMQTPMTSPRSSKSNHHTRHSFGGSSPNHHQHYHHSRRSSSSF